MRLSRNITRQVSMVIILVIFAFTFEACEPSFTIHVHNQTDETLRIFFGDTPIGEAVPGGEIRFDEPAIFSKYIIVAKDMAGDTAYTANFTDQDFRGKDTFHIYFPPIVRPSQYSGNATGK